MRYVPSSYARTVVWSRNILIWSINKTSWSTIYAEWHYSIVTAIKNGAEQVTIKSKRFSESGIIFIKYLWHYHDYINIMITLYWLYKDDWIAESPWSFNEYVKSVIIYNEFRVHVCSILTTLLLHLLMH